MKKYFVFAFTALAAFMNYSCSEVDNPGSPATPVYNYDGKEYVANVVATFQGEVGAEVSLKLGVYTPFDVFAVDFGDGQLVIDTVCYQNGGLKDENGVEIRKSATEFKGTIAGKGIVTVYGNSDLWYTVLSGGVAPTSFDQTGLKKLNQFTISGVELASIDLSGYDSLRIFGISQASVNSVNVSNTPKLKNLTINNNSASKFDSKLKSLDVSNCPDLEQLNLMGASAAKPGILEALDLSNNPKLTSLYAQYNKIKSITLPEKAAISFMNLQNNEIESIDLTVVTSFKDTYLNNNKLKAVDLSKLTAGANLYLDGNQLTELAVPVSVKNFQANDNQLTKITLKDATASCKLENNKLTIATLPTKPASLNTASKIKKFTYNPQADMEVTPTGAVLDLSAQAKAKGELEEEVATTFKLTAGDAVLVEGTDYNIEDGKITFLKSATDVIVKMTTTAFPKLGYLATKPFNVTVAAE